MILEELKNSYVTLMQLTRVLSYTEFLFMLIPFFSLLASDNIVTSPTFAISLIVPFPFIFAAGFTYNSIYDMHVDSVDKNPITRGAMSKGKASLFVQAFLLTALFSFLLFYTSIVALLLFAIHVFFGLSYSGLRLRFKEAPIGVFVAGFGFYTAPPLIILTQFGYFSNTALSLLLFIYLTYTGREILHTLLDYEKDAEKGCKTFAVRVGRIKTIVIEHILLLTGFLCILVNSAFSRDPILLGLSFLYGAGYFTILSVQILVYRLRHNLDFLWMSGRWPFFLSRLYLLVVSLIYLQLSPVTLLIVVWAFLTTKHY